MRMLVGMLNDDALLRRVANRSINNSPQQYSETGKHEGLAVYPRLGVLLTRVAEDV